MLILLITRWPERPSATDASDDSFQRHNEAMKNFRRAHPALESSRTRDIVTEDGDMLAPVRGVRLDDNILN